MAGQWHGGKGSRARPYSVDSKTFENNWDNIFKKDKKNESGSMEQDTVPAVRTGEEPTQTEGH